MSIWAIRCAPPDKSRRRLLNLRPPSNLTPTPPRPKTTLATRSARAAFPNLRKPSATTRTAPCNSSRTSSRPTTILAMPSATKAGTLRPLPNLTVGAAAPQARLRRSPQQPWAGPRRLRPPGGGGGSNFKRPCVSIPSSHRPVATWSPPVPTRPRLWGRGRFADAIAQFQEALSLDPDLAEAHLNLAAALFQSGRLPRAIAHGERALSLPPQWRRSPPHPRQYLLHVRPHAGGDFPLRTSFA